MGSFTLSIRGSRPQIVVAALAVSMALAGYVVASVQALPAKTPGFVTVHASLAPQVRAAATGQVDCAKQACFALTFDDGPNSVTTPQILDILDRYHIHATFFVMGSHVAGNEKLLQRMYQSGHEIGNHTWDHPHLTQIPLEQVEAEVNNTQAVIAQAGVPVPRLFRPPYGDMNDAVRAHIPLTIVRWNVDPEDWHPKKYKQVLEHMATHARPGGMVVLHDTEQHTVESLEPLIQQLQASGYILVTASELLDLPAGQPGVFYGR